MSKGKILLNFPCNGLSFISYILFEWWWLTKIHFIDIQDYLFEILAPFDIIVNRRYIERFVSFFYGQLQSSKYCKKGMFFMLLYFLPKIYNTKHDDTMFEQKTNNKTSSSIFFRMSIRIFFISLLSLAACTIFVGYLLFCTKIHRLCSRFVFFLWVRHSRTF